MDGGLPAGESLADAWVALPFAFLWLAAAFYLVAFALWMGSDEEDLRRLELFLPVKRRWARYLLYATAFDIVSAWLILPFVLLQLPQ